jgi:hypothetical protein
VSSCVEGNIPNTPKLSLLSTHAHTHAQVKQLDLLRKIEAFGETHDAQGDEEGDTKYGLDTPTSTQKHVLRHRSKKAMDAIRDDCLISRR